MVEKTPKEAAATERLMKYWTTGEGGLKIGWGRPGDYDKCVTELSKYVPPEQVHGLCQNLHERATGAPAGHAPAELAAKKATGK